MKNFIEFDESRILKLVIEIFNYSKVECDNLWYLLAMNFNVLGKYINSKNINIFSLDCRISFCEVFSFLKSNMISQSDYCNAILKLSNCGNNILKLPEHSKLERV